jgi:rhamnose transport system ATP-binding protein
MLIMDEPTASLAQKEQQQLFTIVRSLRENEVGVIYISHRLEEIFALADRVTVLRDGESVGTHSVCGASKITESELIKMMVGREMQLAGSGHERSRRREAADSAGELVLSLKNVSCAASGIRDVSLDVRAGEIIGLTGLIGAGRTELARVLFGITPADSGEMLLNGQHAVISSPRDAVNQGLAYLPEDRRRHGIILEMPLAANMTMAVHQRIFPGGWLRLDAERQLALHYIRQLAVQTRGPEALGSSLSGGNQQKAALARWLAAQPKIFILDEPTQGVDVGAKVEIHKIIRDLASQGSGVVMISSDLPEVLAMSDRIAVMRGGTVVATLPGGAEAHVVMAAALGQS